MASDRLPEIGSHWVDTDGPDGEIVVTGHDKGSYVLAVSPNEGDVYINSQWFGTRYQPIGGPDA